MVNGNWLMNWIRSSGAQQQTQQHHAFLFKKHLFLDQYINLSDPVEKELIYFQMLHSIRVDRFPITEMEAVRYLLSLEFTVNEKNLVWLFG